MAPLEALRFGQTPKENENDHKTHSPHTHSFSSRLRNKKRECNRRQDASSYANKTLAASSRCAVGRPRWHHFRRTLSRSFVASSPLLWNGSIPLSLSNTIFSEERMHEETTLKQLFREKGAVCLLWYVGCSVSRHAVWSFESYSIHVEPNLLWNCSKRSFNRTLDGPIMLLRFNRRPGWQISWWRGRSQEHVIRFRSLPPQF